MNDTLTQDMPTLWWLDDPQRFWSWVEVAGDAECWLWTGGRGRREYGQITANKTTYRAHRCAWEIANGPIPDGLVVRHTCDNPPCVNPRHLLLGTFADNNRDKVERGRSLTGERHPLCKLSDLDVAIIRRKHAAGNTQVALSAEYGVRQGYISKLVTGKAR